MIAREGCQDAIALKLGSITHSTQSGGRLNVLSERFRKSLAILLALALVLTVLSVAGCKKAEEPAAPETPTSDVVKGGTLSQFIIQPSFISGSDRDERRVMERVLSVATDVALGALAFLDAGRLRDRWGTLTGDELAAGMVRLALTAPEGRVLADAADIREAARAVAP